EICARVAGPPERQTRRRAGGTTGGRIKELERGGGKMRCKKERGALRGSGPPRCPQRTERPRGCGKSQGSRLRRRGRGFPRKTRAPRRSAAVHTPDRNRPGGSRSGRIREGSERLQKAAGTRVRRAILKEQSRDER